MHKLGRCFICFGDSDAQSKTNLGLGCVAWGRECVVLGLGLGGWVGGGRMEGRVGRFYELGSQSQGASYFDFTPKGCYFSQVGCVKQLRVKSESNQKLGLNALTRT